MRRRATFIEVDAETFFGRVADLADAVAAGGCREPETLRAAVTSAKRALLN